MRVPTDLTGQVALVTGGGSGIGAALCRRLATRGASVVVADVDDPGADMVAGEVDGLALHLDVANRGAWDAAMATVSDEFGRLDALALNAGTMSRPRGASTDDDVLRWVAERYEQVRSVNLDGVAYGIIAAQPLLEAADHGRIAVTASGAGLKPLPMDPVYAMTKAGLIGLVRSIAAPLAERGVTIGAVCPGGVDTPMVSPDLKGLDRVFAPPDEIATALEAILDQPVTDSGDIWIARAGQGSWRHQFADADNRPGDLPT